MRIACLALVFLVQSAATGICAADADETLRAALAAETRLDTRAALALFREASQLRPDDAFILQKIARQYSDQVVDLPGRTAKRESIEQALAYARRALALEPASAENVLSEAVCYGTLALLGSTREKVEYSRLMRESAERALALDPNYAWAHHLLGRWHYEVCGLNSGAKLFVRFFYGGLPAASTAEAVRHLERAVELEPAQLQHRLELGFAYLAAGDARRARSSFAAGLGLPSRAKHDEPAKARARAAQAQLPDP